MFNNYLAEILSYGTVPQRCQVDLRDVYFEYTDLTWYKKCKYSLVCSLWKLSLTYLSFLP